MSLRNAVRHFAFGFLNPDLCGFYVLLAVISATTFGTCYFGYGSWFRIGGLLFLIFIPSVCILLIAVILAGRLQIWIWKRLAKQPEVSPSQMPLLELFWRAAVAMLIVPLLFGYFGGRLCERRAQKPFAESASLIAELENEKKLHGFYPTNVISLVKSNTVLRRRYYFYYGESGTNGIEWTADQIAKADISIFTTTTNYQIVIPIEKMSPITYSSFYVYSYTSEYPLWNKVLLHWSLLGAYIDNPSH